MIKTSLDNKIISSDIQEKIQKNENFLNYIIQDDAYAIDITSTSRNIAIPQASTLPKVSVDSTAALSVQDSTDIHSSYTIHSYRTSPILIRNFEEYFTNYDKQQNIAQNQAAQLKDTFTKHAVYLWSKQGEAKAIKTTGAKRSASYGSGNRKALTFSDILKIRQQLIKDGGSQGSGSYFAVINSALYGDLIQTTEVKSGNYALTNASTPGAAFDFLGFTFFLREDLPSFNVNKVPAIDTYGTTPSGASAGAGALFFHKDFVRRAISSHLAVYADVSASRAGVELSSELFAGTSLVRTDAKGFVVLTEDKE